MLPISKFGPAASTTGAQSNHAYRIYNTVRSSLRVKSTVISASATNAIAT
jgi:hypothetical protein